MPTNNTTTAGESDGERLRETLESLALAAGRCVMDVFNSTMTVERKVDDSPVTEADRSSEHLILGGLRSAFPDIPCVAEEEAS